MSDVKQAEKTLDTLRAKRDALVAHGVELGETRTQLAFGAHTGNDKARKQLDAINRESALHDSELRSIDAALSEGAKRLAAAQAVEAQAANRQRATRQRFLPAMIGGGTWECEHRAPGALAERRTAIPRPCSEADVKLVVEIVPALATTAWRLRRGLR